MSEQELNEKIKENIQDSTEQNNEEAQDKETVELTEVEKLTQELTSEKEQHLRLYAEFDNFKKRTAKERVEFFKTANQEVIVALLPIIDDFERGLKEVEKVKDETLLKGMGLIQNKLLDTLRAKGLKAMETKAGDDFNTDLHEAITQIPAPEENLKGKIIDVVETGYLLNDKVIRYAKVVVGQ